MKMTAANAFGETVRENGRRVGNRDEDGGRKRLLRNTRSLRYGGKYLRPSSGCDEVRNEKGLRVICHLRAFRLFVCFPSWREDQVTEVSVIFPQAADEGS